MVIAGGILMATGVGGPAGAMLISGGISMGIQKATTGEVDPAQLALDMIPGGMVVQAFAGGASGAYNYYKSPGPHTPGGVLKASAVEAGAAALPGPTVAGRKALGATVDTGGPTVARQGLSQPALGSGPQRLALEGGSSSQPVSKLEGLHPVPIGPVEEKAHTVLTRVDEKGAAFPGYSGGKSWKNSNSTLPAQNSISYQEWDVDPKIKGILRNADRLVTGSDGSAYYTTNHYESFTMIRGGKPE